MKRCLCADILIRYLICSIFHIPSSNIKFHLNLYGKMDLAHFNVSYPREYIFAGIGNYEIGGDIRKITDYSLNVGKHLLLYMKYKFLALLICQRGALFF